MDYLARITTAHTVYTQASPFVTPLKLTKGRLQGGWLYFPTGPAGTLHLVVNRGLHQILPANQGATYALNDCVVPFFLGLDLFQPPLTLDILTWNESTQYPHTCTICFFLDTYAAQREKKGWLSKVLSRQPDEQ